MKHKKQTKLWRCLSIAIGLSLANSALSQSQMPEQSYYILGADSTLALVLETTSNQPTSAVSISGLNAGDEIVAIDVRPQTGKLYGLGQNPKTGTVQLYLLDYRRTSALAIPVGSAGSFVETNGNPIAILANGFDMDFNPTVDRIRIVNTAGLNFRMNPNDGALLDGNFGGAAGSVAGLNPDARLNGAATSGMGTAYTNNEFNAALTTQYTLDHVSNSLLIQQPPNAGTLVSSQAITVGGSALDFAPDGGIDIQPGINANAAGSAATGDAIAVLTSGGIARLYRINLSTGAATLRGDLGGLNAIDVAVLNTRAAAFALTQNGTQLLRFGIDSPMMAATASISGVVAGETLVGIDLRPANGVLYALGIDGSNDRGTLYRLEPQSMGTTAVATVIGTAGQIALVDALGIPIDLSQISHGIDFNPVVDRLRVVDSSGLNFRINPDTGAAVDGDAAAAGTNPDMAVSAVLGTQIAGVAYTNAVAGASATTQYTIDQAAGTLNIQNPPNSGIQTMVRPILLGSTPALLSGVGFDIAPGVATASANTPVAAGSGYFTSSTSAGMPQLYRLDLTTAQASLIGNIGVPSAQDLEGLTVTQAPLAFALAANSVDVMEQAAPATITINRASGGAGIVRFSTANGTAMAGTDYTATSGTLVFGNGDLSAQIMVPVLVDALDEGPETFLINLILPSGQTQSLTVRIVNDRLFMDGFE
jgi:Domain of unknown function (DUF4394)/Calx-beta domain